MKMKKYIFIACAVFNISDAMALVPPTACPAGEIAYNLPSVISVAYNKCPTNTVTITSSIGGPYGFLIASSNTPYKDTFGTYEYYNMVCVYE